LKTPKEDEEEGDGIKLLIPWLKISSHYKNDTCNSTRHSAVAIAAVVENENLFFKEFSFLIIKSADGRSAVEH
jgi:hypothetical protein